MERINTTNKEADLFGAGKHGFRDGNPGGGIFATFLSATWFNTVQEELANIVEGFGDILSAADRTQLRKALFQSPAMAMGVDCKNNAATPNSQFDLLARQVSMRRPSNGSLLTIRGLATRTANILTAGPAINARDQVGAFTNSSWVHFYWIGKSDGTYNSIASANDDSVGPTLPADYTHWAYAGACYLDSGGLLKKIRIKGSQVFYETRQSALGAGAATSETAVSVATLAPPNALSFVLSDNNSGASSDGSGNINVTAIIRAVTGSDFWIPVNIFLTGLGASTSARGNNGGTAELPNIGQQFYYLWSIVTGSSQSLSISLISYKIPNGAE